MSEIVKVKCTVFKTTDGRLHESSNAALKRQQILELWAFLEETEGMTGHPCQESLAEALVDEADHICNILRGRTISVKDLR